MPVYDIHPYGFWSYNYQATNEKDSEDAFELVQDSWLGCMSPFSSGYKATMAARSPGYVIDSDASSGASDNDNSNNEQLMRVEEVILGWTEGGCCSCFLRPAFALYNAKNIRYATVIQENAETNPCCSADYFYKVVKAGPEPLCRDKVKEIRSSDDNSSITDDESEEDESPVWMTIIEDVGDDLWLSNGTSTYTFRLWRQPEQRSSRRGMKKRRNKYCKLQKVARLSINFSLCSPQHRLQINHPDTTREERHTIMALGLLIVKLAEEKRHKDAGPIPSAV